MDIKPIKTDADYEAALQEIERLMDAESDTPKGDRLDVLVTLVEAYEAKHYPIEDPDPIATIVHRMEALGITRKELEPMIGARGRVAEILGRKRPLTLTMIRRLTKGMRIPAEVLIQPYELSEKQGTKRAQPG
jgi:HTH-type transcriptional regulator/antitoxin HigA